MKYHMANRGLQRSLTEEDERRIQTIEDELEDAWALIRNLQRVIRTHAHECKAFSGHILESLWEVS